MRAKFTVVLVVSLLAAILASGCINAGSGNNQELPVQTSNAENTVEITARDFNPSTLTISLGETVTFINKDSKEHWPASNIHPTHLEYPESGGCIGSAFDACKGLRQGETFSFTFNQKGSWQYHDHLQPNLVGTIKVE